MRIQNRYTTWRDITMHDSNYKAWRWHDNIRFIVVLIVGRWWALHPKSCSVGSGAPSHQHNHELTVRQPVQPREHLPVQARGRGGEQLGLGIQPGMTQITFRPTVKDPCFIYAKCPLNYIIRHPHPPKKLSLLSCSKNV